MDQIPAAAPLPPDAVAQRLMAAQDALDQAARMPQPAAPVPPDVAAQMQMAAQDALDQAARMPRLSPFAIGVDVDAQVQLQLDKIRQMDFDQLYDRGWSEAQEKAMAKMEEAQEKMAAADAKLAGKFEFPPLAFQQRMGPGQRGGDEGMYQSGLNDIDNHQYDQALSEFNNVAARGGPRTEGALYWKAYVLNKLGRAADAQAAIDTLRKMYPSSRWLDDAKVLELEVKQSKGPVSPESEMDDDIKILALNGLMQSDPDKALPQLENMLKGSHSPKLKRQALVVLAQNSSPKAQQDLEQIARGGNPDLQVRAIQYLASKRNASNAQLFLEIYAATSDPAVKRAILSAFSGVKDKDNLFKLAKGEKDGNLRASAFSELGRVDGQPELWQIYQGETTTEGKVTVLNYMHQNGNLEKLAEVARTDKDPKVRQEAIRAIASQEAGTQTRTSSNNGVTTTVSTAPAGTGAPWTTLVSLYNGEQDQNVKQTIIDSLSRPRDCRPLVDVAKAEKDVKLKLRIVERLSGMTKSCPAATDYLTELLNK
jgi:hypothetical protein